MSYVEVLDGHGRVFRRVALPLDAGQAARIGRDFGCEVVIDDPHVAALHLWIKREDDGGLRLEDAGSLNGMLLPGRSGRAEGLRLGPDSPAQELQIGRTRLRVHARAPRPAPELPLPDQPRLWPLALLALASGFGLLLGSQWLAETREFRWMTRIAELLPLLMLLGIWSAGWALVNRMLAGRALYSAHLAVAGLALAAYVLAAGLLDTVAYALSLSWLPAYGFVPGWLALGLASLIHLRLLGEAQLGLKFAAVLLVVLLGMTPRMIQLAYPEPGEEPSHVLRTLLPPGLRLARPQTLDAFLEAADRLRPKLDAARDAPAAEVLDGQPEDGSS